MLNVRDRKARQKEWETDVGMSPCHHLAKQKREVLGELRRQIQNKRMEERALRRHLKGGAGYGTSIDIHQNIRYYEEKIQELQQEKKEIEVLQRLYNCL